MLTKTKNGKILTNNSCPNLANPTILRNVEETVKTTADPPKIPSEKPDFHVSQILEKAEKSFSCFYLLLCHVSGKT